jgi:hypothetical protein
MAGMSFRRTILLLGVTGLTVSAARHVNAATGEVSASGYGGESTGGWICGPVGPMKYGGAAVDVKLAQRSVHDARGEGAHGEIAVAGEYEHTTFTRAECTGDCPGAKADPPPDRVLVGGAWRAGYRARNWGVDAGGGVYQGFREAGDRSPSVAFYPQLEARGGVSGPNAVFGVLGFGAPLPTMALRPGLYTGMSVDSRHGFGVDARFGAYRQGPALTDGDSLAIRGDLGARVDLGRHVGVRVGGAIGAPSRSVSTPNLEGSAGVVARF